MFNYIILRGKCAYISVILKSEFESQRIYVLQDIKIVVAIRYGLKTDLSGLTLASSPTSLQRENFLHSYRILFFRFSSHKKHTVWRACLVGSGQAPASTLLRSPG